MNLEEEPKAKTRLRMLPKALYAAYQNNAHFFNLVQRWMYTDKPIEDLYVQAICDLNKIIGNQQKTIMELMARAPLQGGGRFPHQNEP